MAANRFPGLIAALAVNIRDIAPGELQDLTNVSRRPRSHGRANTARLLADNPPLIRLREQELLEKIAANSQLSVVLGEKRLTDRIENVL